ncbi:MAG: MotA/TolQ/ExbB proton channel family protein [Candidatus Adiutrix sp.]|jgi:TolQ protein|nr:MotA/TolQ/ExbB proton channel family protein [Candidatus Adiutrix sp.]
MNIADMFQHADPVVQTVMTLLLLASVSSWCVIFEKIVILRRTGREVRHFKKVAAGLAESQGLDQLADFSRGLAESGFQESRDQAGRETRADFRERVERSMRAALAGRLDQLNNRVLFLATVGAISPFVGLFGTVWGIMHSFAGIAATGETSLAVVAPGIAEALFATAMGLVAAIPAVVAYNKIAGSIKKIGQQTAAGISDLGNRLAGRHFASLENAS